MGTIYELILVSFFGSSDPLFLVPRFGFGLALGFSGRGLVEDFCGSMLGSHRPRTSKGRFLSSY